MPNGVAVALPLDPPSASVPAQAAAGTASEIGTAMAAATIMVCRATLNHRQAGVLDQDIKNAGASAIAHAAMLLLNHEFGDDDFINKARDAGRCALRRYFIDEPYSPAEADAAIDMCLGKTLDIVMHVVDGERRFVRAMAH